MDINKLDSERNRLNIQMRPEELAEIVRAIDPLANFLIFGFGNDSIFWHENNKGGRTVFIEDNPQWYEAIKKKHPFLEGYLVDYETKREDWQAYIDRPDRLDLQLPDSIRETQWDIILVDGPAGYEDGKSGRMKSIYMASKLIKASGHIFVHDAERKVEKIYCDKFLLNSNLIRTIKGGAVLHHYKFPQSS